MAELYRAKGGTVSVEANKVEPSTVEAVALWCGGVLVIEHDALQHDTTFVAINVPTPQGMKRAQEGDWIIKRPLGDFYPVEGYRFFGMFEAVVDG